MTTQPAEVAEHPDSIGTVPPAVQDHELMSQIVEVSADAIFSEKLDGTITSWNAAAERVYGHLASHMIGRSSSALVPARSAAELESTRDIVRTGRRVERFDTWHLAADGRHIAVSVTVSPLRDSSGELSGLATSVHDATDRMQLAAGAEDARRALARQNLALARSNRDLEQFAFVASHDLSEPLRTMSGFVQLLDKRYAGQLDERARGYMSHVIQGAARMKALIDDLLEYSRHLTTEPASRMVDTTALARRAVEDLGGSAAVRVDVLPDVWCHESSVLALFHNLISNALKFRRADAPPRVEVTGWVEDGRTLIAVDDNGIGIDPEHREQVFRMFARLHVREAYTGTGIGLAIVQQVVERAGGEVRVEESLLGGTRFCVALPAAPQVQVEL